MSTGPSRAIGSPTKFAYVCKEGNFEDTGLFDCFAVDLFPKTNRISRRTSEPCLAWLTCCQIELT